MIPPLACRARNGSVVYDDVIYLIETGYANIARIEDAILDGRVCIGFVRSMDGARLVTNLLVHARVGI